MRYNLYRFGCSDSSGKRSELALSVISRTRPDKWKTRTGGPKIERLKYPASRNKEDQHTLCTLQPQRPHPRRSTPEDFTASHCQPTFEYGIYPIGFFSFEQIPNRTMTGRAAPEQPRFPWRSDMLEGKKAIVTGGSAGIGAAITEALVRFRCFCLCLITRE